MIDADLIVVGGGPAGLSAALRAAWLGISPSNRLLPLRIFVLEACKSLGGLSRWQPLRTYAPQMFFTNRDLDKLIRGCIDASVNIRHERALSVVFEGDKIVIKTVSDDYRCEALIISSGMKLSFEAEPQLYRRRKLFFESTTDPEHLLNLVRELEEVQNNMSFLVCGSEPVVDLFSRVARTATKSRIYCIAEPPYARIATSDNLLMAKVTDMVEDDIGVCVSARRFDSGTCEVIRAGAVILDFKSYELQANSLDGIAPPTLNSSHGFVRTDSAMQTNILGVFCAGDITGAPFAVGKALSQGMVAGIFAYAYLYERRTGKRPDLYPYMPLRNF